MTPRERAEALGWVRDDVVWVAYGLLVVQVVPDGSGRWRSGPIRPRAAFPTEDEALAHALLLLDVWLS